MKDFLTNQQIDHAPPFSPILQFSIFAVLIGLIFLTMKYGYSRKFQRFFLYAQAIQLLIFNSWHLLMAFSWEHSLPIYHCRLAMWALLLLPDQNKFKQYFALMGLSGAILTFVYPVMDHYAFPHITAFNFILSHILLFANSFIYLYRSYDGKRLSIQQITVYTFVLNAFLLLANQLTGGNYGLLRFTPFIADQALWIRYLAVSISLTASMVIIDWGFRYLQVHLSHLTKKLHEAGQ
jgi:hypothetical integral membrane protein (TIGR02206 family)